MNIANENDEKTYVIPDKNEVLKKLENDTRIYKSKLIEQLYNLSIKMRPTSYLSIEYRTSLLWDLVERILNVSIGGILKAYRSDTLTRVNNVTFRQRVAVKCEIKSI